MISEKEILRILSGISADAYNRLLIFFDLQNHCRMNPKTYWKGLADAYTCSDDTYRYKEIIRKLFGKNLPRREELMTTSEKKYFNALPNSLTIYRGMTVEESKSKDYGISWSLKESIAEFYCNSYMRNHSTYKMPKTIVKLLINKKEVIAYFNNRKEEEIIYLGNGTKR